MRPLRLVIENLTAFRGEQPPLDLGEYELFAISGPTGSGKTTLLKMVAGTLKPDRGEVTVGASGAIAGVLLVFSYLIVPAVCGINLAVRFGNRLLTGWIIALIGGVAGLFLSYWWDLPSGAAIVCTFGGLLILISFIGLCWRRAKR
jgi:membrane associated rhomboid family serine protease